MTGPVSYGARLSQLAAERPDGTAFLFVSTAGDEQPVRWRDLDEASNRLGRRLADAGVGQGSMVVTAMPNSIPHVVAMYAAWKVGACVLPLRSDLPAWERERVLAVAGPDVILGDWKSEKAPVIPTAELEAKGYSAAPLPDRVPMPAKAIATSGSTGTPKIIVLRTPGTSVPGGGEGPHGAFLGHREGQIQLVPAPLYHANGFYILQFGLFGGQQIILMERFDAELAVELIERHRVNTFAGVTIMLQRMARVPGIHQRDLSSLESVLHGGAPLPEWLARTWIDLVGPDHFFVSYGSSENAGIALANGHQWLAHPTTVGHPFNTVARILDDDGRDLPAGEIGEIYLRWSQQAGESFSYSGDVAARRTADGWSSLGDMGWMDDDGYLYLADRRKDMIISGGANVYPAEVEAALSEDPEVADVVVVGVADPEWGQRVHAVIQARDLANPPPEERLREHCRERLARYKVPKTIEFVARIPRTEAGKVRRSAVSEAGHA
ncbi:MAG: AMP-binding protein [Acidimicrobiaceae bacterium]|nr:AMP-binding protein [Acidimicrobiaceae bacterium]